MTTTLPPLSLILRNSQATCSTTNSTRLSLETPEDIKLNSWELRCSRDSALRTVRIPKTSTTTLSPISKSRRSLHFATIPLAVVEIAIAPSMR